MKNPVDIGDARQFFIDDLIIEEMNGVTKVINQPAKYEGRIRHG